MAARMGEARHSEPGNAGAALLEIVDAENPPRRVLFGTEPIEIIEPLYAERLKTWAEWQHVSRIAQG